MPDKAQTVLFSAKCDNMPSTCSVVSEFSNYKVVMDTCMSGVITNAIGNTSWSNQHQTACPHYLYMCTVDTLVTSAGIAVCITRSCIVI